jgi:glutaredoxin
MPLKPKEVAMKSLTVSTAKTLALIAAVLLVAGSVAAGKLYKWTDKDGKVHYTDQPPPAEARASEHKKFGDKPNEVPMPYSLRQAVKNFPVTLYNTDCGEGCAKASAFLTQRGVPFTEKNPRDAAVAEELQALTGGKLEVPVMKLGSQVIRGYEEGSWKTALDAAGYPSSPVTPLRAASATPKPAPAAGKPEGPAAAEAPAQGAPTEPGATRPY